jgi:hypothetical protein
VAAQQEPVLSVETKWCGTVVLRRRAWQHAVEKHPEVAPYLDLVRQTLEAPSMIYDKLASKPTIAFYAQGLIHDNPRYRDCYVCVFVRSEEKPPCVCTVYLPSRLSKNPGKLLYLRK